MKSEKSIPGNLQNNGCFITKESLTDQSSTGIFYPTVGKTLFIVIVFLLCSLVIASRYKRQRNSSL